MDLAAAQEIDSTLDEWAWELSGQVPAPAEPRPDEADRQVRDYVKDVIRDRAAAERELERLKGYKSALTEQAP
ncbi:hypothetical protein [Dactylosporangium sp. NPDC000521]|uniref:hypothetical protein n=1 Tax=Dactylosporangium sp. NPDC000521 TaxID=3363975 RepID=UPI0036CEE855